MLIFTSFGRSFRAWAITDALATPGAFSFSEGGSVEVSGRRQNRSMTDSSADVTDSSLESKDDDVEG